MRQEFETYEEAVKKVQDLEKAGIPCTSLIPVGEWVVMWDEPETEDE